MNFRVWAPAVARMDVKVNGRLYPMKRTNESFETDVEDAGAGDDYVYVAEGKEGLPDPASRHQPHGVHGPSRIVDPNSFLWTDGAWRNIPLKEYIFYELHIGTFTPEGTFFSAAEKLPHLVDLGITAVEVMPIAEFPGSRNWGYDGVHLYAVEDSYGGPNGLKFFVNACHRHGIAAVLDVVYNHAGPEGNYLGEFGPYFTSKHKTLWGGAFNYDDAFCDGVRRYIIDNALYWVQEYHVDALRLDAVHAIHDLSAKHLLEELAEAFQNQSAYLIAESDLNDPRIITPIDEGGYGLDAQWNDEFHHAVMARLACRSDGYFADFGTLDQIAKALTDGYVHDGDSSLFRKRRHGRSSRKRPGEQFVIFLQNHDQIANAFHGKRIGSILPWAAEKIAATLLFTAPNPPLLFMGQEYGERANFEYFIDHGDPALRAAVTKGRQREHEVFGLEFHAPDDPGTYTTCKLDWNSRNQEVFDFYRKLIALRKTYPALSNCRKDLIDVECDNEKGWLVMKRRDEETHSTMIVIINFSENEAALPSEPEGPPLFSTLGIRASGPMEPLSARIYEH